MLRAATLTLLVGSVILILWTFRQPALPAITPANAATDIARTANGLHLTKPLEAFDSVSERRLGAPLYDPPPKPRVVKSVGKPVAPPPVTPQEEPSLRDMLNGPKKRKKKNQSGLRVAGTVIEAGKSMAIIVDATGAIQLRSEGDTVTTPTGEGQVDKIELEQITISFDDETLTLKVP